MTARRLATLQNCRWLSLALNDELHPVIMPELPKQPHLWLHMAFPFHAVVSELPNQ